jgi:hypothetical protein
VKFKVAFWLKRRILKMDNTTIIIVVAALIAVAAIAAVGWMYLQKKQSGRLRSRFGSEYDRLAEVEGGRGRAEKTLHEREKRVERFNLVPLSRWTRTSLPSNPTSWTPGHVFQRAACLG